jgi:hypothetical protein
MSNGDYSRQKLTLTPLLAEIDIHSNLVAAVMVVIERVRIDMRMRIIDIATFEILKGLHLVRELKRVACRSTTQKGRNVSYM